MSILAKKDNAEWYPNAPVNVQHSAKSVEHYTPPSVVEAARQTMGGIDLDPASCATANRVVRATDYYNKSQDGLSREWHGRVLNNPPGGKTQGKSNSVVWWSKLVDEWQYGRVEQAIFIGFSIEILQTSQRGTGPVPLDFPFCVPSGRLDFLDENLEPQGSPTHANVVVLLPPRVDTAEAIERFKVAFKDIGRVVVPR